MTAVTRKPETRFYHPTAAKIKSSYSPHVFLNAAAKTLGVKNDQQLAKALDLLPSMLSKIRSRSIPVTPYAMLRVIEATGWTVEEARKKLGA